MAQNNRRGGHLRGGSRQGNRNGRGANGGHAGYQLYGGDARGLYNSGYSTGGRRGNRSTMIYGKQRKTWPKVVLAIAVVLIVVACVWQFACGGLPFLSANEQSQDQQQEATQEQQDDEATAQDLTRSDANGTYQAGLDTSFTVTAIGDCTLGTDSDFDTSTNFVTKYNDTSERYFFQNVAPVLSADDLTIGNFEGTLTESTDIQQKAFNFKAPASYAGILKAGSVEAVNVANNHSFDYGQQGFDDTKKNLSAADITNFGYDRTATYEVNGIKIGLFGISQLDGTDKATTLTQSDIKSLQDEGCQLIIGMFHWGIEGENVPESEQVSLAHAAIDAGCDLVIGGHPHVLQGVEYYKNRYICYSMGNFCFGGNTHPADFDTMMYQQTFTFKDGQLVMDDTTKAQVDIIPCSVSSSSSINNYQLTPLTGERGSVVVSKLNGFSKKLSGTPVSFDTELDSSGRAALAK